MKKLLISILLIGICSGCASSQLYEVGEYKEEVCNEVCVEAEKDIEDCKKEKKCVTVDRYGKHLVQEIRNVGIGVDADHTGKKLKNAVINIPPINTSRN